MLLPWMLEEGCLDRPFSPSCAFLSCCPMFISSTSGCPWPRSVPWEEEGSSGDQDVQAAPGSLLGRSAGKSESSPTPAHSKYPSIPQETSEELIQSHSS